ncbi:hypothetical protein LEP1GSC062_0905 [Leptospira alexanderi serovar Manhao 3 str. L 60]|uniref:Uncharacterized protein n=1 Tax=Leptospira alexanderi serovar Manhao 3 str. L 60 TaxID=1049759 RepID=V6IFJ1_9LEPT|nr:hypothetical protein LEP1GSC062_0905 [Leptospira alexanderi serovar Manhao 3 str. L 60]
MKRFLQIRLKFRSGILPYFLFPQCSEFNTYDAIHIPYFLYRIYTDEKGDPRERKDENKRDEL